MKTRKVWVPAWLWLRMHDAALDAEWDRFIRKTITDRNRKRTNTRGGAHRVVWGEGFRL